MHVEERAGKKPQIKFQNLCLATMLHVRYYLTDEFLKNNFAARQSCLDALLWSGEARPICTILPAHVSGKKLVDDGGCL